MSGISEIVGDWIVTTCRQPNRVEGVLSGRPVLSEAKVWIATGQRMRNGERTVVNSEGKTNAEALSRLKEKIDAFG